MTLRDKFKPYLDEVIWPKSLQVSYGYAEDSITLIFYKDNWHNLNDVDSILSAEIAKETATYLEDNGCRTYVRIDE